MENILNSATSFVAQFSPMEVLIGALIAIVLLIVLICVLSGKNRRIDEMEDRIGRLRDESDRELENMNRRMEANERALRGELREKTEALEGEMSDKESAYETAMREKETAYETAMQEKETAWQTRLDETETAHRETLTAKEQAWQSEMAEKEQAYSETIDRNEKNYKAKIAEKEAAFDAGRNALARQLEEKDERIRTLTDQLDVLSRFHEEYKVIPDARAEASRIIREAKDLAFAVSNRTEKEYTEIIDQANREAESVRGVAQARLQRSHEALKSALARANEIIEEAHLEAARFTKESYGKPLPRIEAPQEEPEEQDAEPEPGDAAEKDDAIVEE
ncbi:MAG: hypothetical protein IKE30_03670 [Clostridia bacterium]|nr:hypothetical protein [Clostridia bacterium]